MKQILGLTLAALLVIGLVGGGTWAYFSDVETSTGNVLAAGTLNLNINSGDVNVNILSLTDAAPGNSGGNFTQLINVGNLAGELDITVTTVISDENTNIEPEQEDGDFTTGPGNGELTTNMWLAFWLDYEGLGNWDANDITLNSDTTVSVYSADQTSGTASSGDNYTVTDTGAGWGVDAYKGYPVTVSGKGTRVIISNTSDTLTVASKFTTGVVSPDAYAIHDGPFYDTADNFANDIIDAAIANMSASGTLGDNYDFYINWVIPSTVNNVIMSDNITINLTFTLEQIAAD